MKLLVKISTLVVLLTVAFFNTSFAQINGDTFESGDENLGDLDELEQSIAVSINLETILQLHGPEDPSVSFVFDEMEEFKQGIKAEDPTNGDTYVSEGVTNGIHDFSVDATVNWKVDWRADIDGDFVEGVNTGGNRDQKLAINNVGAKFVTDEATNQIEATDTEAIALSSDDFTVITRAENTSNIGDANANRFSLAWRVGTQETPENSSTPAMNTESLLTQQIGSEAFMFDVIFTLSQDDPWIQ